MAACLCENFLSMHVHSAGPPALTSQLRGCFPTSPRNPFYQKVHLLQIAAAEQPSVSLIPTLWGDRDLCNHRVSHVYLVLVSSSLFFI